MPVLDSFAGPLPALFERMPLVESSPSSHQNSTAPQFTDNQLAILRGVSLTFSLVSITAGFYVFYWFVRMRRSYRHDLIMLLILCDMLKSFWFIVFPLVEIFHGPVESSSSFCQASGFFVALGIEACDAVILMIAIHTALYIFRSRRSGYGLYPYRQYAHAILTTVPALLAALAFTGGSGYTNLGQYCYLPSRPLVYQVTLSWIPRYAIFIIILSIYASIYIHVRRLMRRYGAASGTVLPAPEEPAQHERSNRFDDERNLPSNPPLTYHRLLSLPRSRSASLQPSVDYDRSTVDTMKDSKFDLRRMAFQNSMQWKWPAISADTRSVRRQSLPLPDEPPPSTPSPHTPPLTTPLHPAYNTWHGGLSTSDSGHTSSSSWTRKRSSTSSPTAARPGGFRRFLASFPGCLSPLKVDNEDVPGSRGSHADRSSLLIGTSALGIPGMSEQREKIQRQLRLLFAYPLVYMVMWTVPSISAILCYTDRFAEVSHQPFVLLVLSLASLTAQGAVDAWLFSSRERPWRHSRKGFFEGLGWRIVGAKASTSNVRDGVGRTREEMEVDGRIARIRRDQEIIERRREGKTTMPDRHTNKEWWEVGVDDDNLRWPDIPPAIARRPDEEPVGLPESYSMATNRL